MTVHNFLACDLGAESGRVMLGAVSSSGVDLKEVHRFPNQPVRLPDGLYWDVLRLFHEIREGLRAGSGIPIKGIGIDTWGVDFALLDRNGSLVANPRHYRDARNNGIVERLCDLIPRADVFDATGIQFMQINSLCQLLSMKLSRDTALERARTLLMIPDLFNYWLTGQKAAERTIASTTQFYNPRARAWAADLLARLGLAADILPEIVDPGTHLGEFDSMPVYASAGHDTAAAVAAVPAEGDDWSYISSGTWSLMGVEVDAPIMDAAALAANFTNEIGVGGKVRLLKNIAGLWPLQECRRAWAAEGREYTYAELMEMAENAPSYSGYIDPDRFIEPGNMPARIIEYCKTNGQPLPVNPGEMTRAILESLARRYHEVLTTLESLTGRSLRVIHIVGGGSRNVLLNRLVEEKTGRRVVAGPVEATALGNVLAQAIGAGVIPDLAAGRELIRRSLLRSD